MAGFTAMNSPDGPFQFHLDNKDLANRIRKANDNKKVIMLQLDCDELDAALWGLENYKKESNTPTEPPWTVDQLLDNTFCKINGKHTKLTHEPVTKNVIFSNGPLEGPGEVTYCFVCGWILKEELDKPTKGDNSG